MPKVLEIEVLPLPVGKRWEPDPREGQLEYYLGEMKPPVLASYYVTSLPPREATPAKLYLGALGSPGLRARTPLPLIIEREGEYIVVHPEGMEEFGYGKYLSEAIRDLQLALEELYFTLKRDQGNLGEDLMRVWRQLVEWIEER